MTIDEAINILKFVKAGCFTGLSCIREEDADEIRKMLENQKFYKYPEEKEFIKKGETYECVIINEEGAELKWRVYLQGNEVNELGQWLLIESEDGKIANEEFVNCKEMDFKVIAFRKFIPYKKEKK